MIMIDTTALLTWFDLHERPLPWRKKTPQLGDFDQRGHELINTCVAVKLQWQEWIERWPTPLISRKLARPRSHGPGQVGHMLYCVQIVRTGTVDKHGGEFDNVDELRTAWYRRLYCAWWRAYFGQDVPVVDINVPYRRAVTGTLQPQPSTKELTCRRSHHRSAVFGRIDGTGGIGVHGEKPKVRRVPDCAQLSVAATWVPAAE